MSLISWYENEKRSLKERYLQQLQDLDEELEIRQEECDHVWEFCKDLFYAMGNTYDGEKCSECGKERKLRC